jgi:carbohydrate diacid regulator
MSRLDASIAREIVARTMHIIDHNINVMDAQGCIVASGDESRIGQIHEGALLALAQSRTVTIDEAMALRLFGVKPGVNLPLRSEGSIVGVIGLTGTPESVMQLGELVRMSAEMTLEQSRLTSLLARNARLREELVLELVRAETPSPTLVDWARQLGVDLTEPRVATLIEIDCEALDADVAFAELQRLQQLLTTPERGNLIATASLNEIVVLKPVRETADGWDMQEHRDRALKLLSRMRAESRMTIRIALGEYFPGPGGLARSWRTARATMQMGRARDTEACAFFYHDLVLPVLLEELQGSWQAAELARPVQRLTAADARGTLRQTLSTWFACNMQPVRTAQALGIHRNTLDYRLGRISEICALNLDTIDSCLLLYAGMYLSRTAKT